MSSETIKRLIVVNRSIVFLPPIIPLKKEFTVLESSKYVNMCTVELELSKSANSLTPSFVPIIPLSRILKISTV